MVGIYSSYDLPLECSSIFVSVKFWAEGVCEVHLAVMDRAIHEKPNPNRRLSMAGGGNDALT